MPSASNIIPGPIVLAGGIRSKDIVLGCPHRAYSGTACLRAVPLSLPFTQFFAGGHWLRSSMKVIRSITVAGETSFTATSPSSSYIFLLLIRQKKWRITYVCMCILLLPCTPRVWAVTKSQLNTSCR